LKINEGTRPAGMGGAYTAMGDDVYSVSYNPAGLSYITASQVVMVHLDSLAQIQYEYLTFGTAWGAGNVLAVNFTYRHSPPIDNDNGQAPAVTYDLLGSLSYARKLTSNLRAGLTVKYLESVLDVYSASAIAFDAGLVLDHLPFGIRAGLAVQNVGTGMTFVPAGSGSSSGYPSESLPMFIRFGLGTHQVIDGTKDLNLGVEVFKPSDQDIKMGFGGEVWLFPELFAIRGGYKLEGFQATGNVFQNYSLGCTLTRKIEGDDFSIDIAYDPADFDTTSQDTFFFGLNFKFNQLRFF
jgi:hypothetical protein